MPIKISPDSLTQRELIALLPAVEAIDLEPRYELMAFGHRVASKAFSKLKKHPIEVGTPPVANKTCEYSFCSDFLSQFPIHRFEGAMVFTEHAWRLVEDLISKEFYIVRRYDLETGNLLERIGPEEVLP